MSSRMGKTRSYLLDWRRPARFPIFFIDVERIGVDFLGVVFPQKCSRPPWRGRGFTPKKKICSRRMRPFLYGGDMIGWRQVSPEKVEYNSLPWKFTAGTAQYFGHDPFRLKLFACLSDFALNPGKRKIFFDRKRAWFGPRWKLAMKNIHAHEKVPDCRKH